MSLLEVVRNLESLDNEYAIYAARPWSPMTNAIIAQEPGTGDLPSEARVLGFDYFLEIFLAQDLLHDLQTEQANTPDLIARCERLIRYAETDA